MDNISICVSFIAAILGIAYPILFEVISRVDEKYSSQTILELFRREKENRFFIVMLKISLISILLWMLKLPRLIDIKSLNYFISNSAQYILILSSILLIISFFLFVKKVLIYYTPNLFIPYIIKRHSEEIN